MKLQTIIRHVLLTGALLLGTNISAQEVTQSTKPNIIVILVDDMGYSDLSCYGGEIPTPHLDGLAKNGLRFTQFYNTARCCPTRASLLTGLYPHQTGVGHMNADDQFDGYRGRLNEQCVTMAEVLQPAGYFTAMSGKWHVGQNHGVTPVTRGFMRSLNMPAGGFYHARNANGIAQLFLNGRKLDVEGTELPKDWYSTDLWTDYGLKFIDEARAARKPFFLYLAHNAPHFPLQADAATIAKYRGKYQAGWDVLRRARYRRQLELGIIDKAWPASERPAEIAPWDSLTEAQKDRFDHLMAIYAATVERMDKAVGDLVTGLRQRGEFDNTLILFMSDNGGNAEAGPQGRMDGPGAPGTAESVVFCGESWAYLQNTPFRQYKHYNHEGGIATPLIAHWPQGIKARNELRHQPGHVIDIMATVIDVSGAQYPTEFKGNKIQPLAGRSLRPAFANKAIQREALFWEHEGNRAIRVGDWKLVSFKDQPWELYNLKRDRTELKNLAASEPARVKQLVSQWQAWANRARVTPGPAKFQKDWK